MLNISKDLNASINGLNRRIVQVEQNLEKNLVEKLTSVIHLTVKEEISKARSDFDSEICAMKLKLSDMEKVMQDHNGTINAGDTAQKPCSVIIRNLRESPNEAEGSNPIAKNKVISLVRDGLKLRDVRVNDAERKKANGDNPGLIVATFESHEQVAAVLKAKTDLRKTNDYSSVYIEPFLSQAELSTQTTFRTILREIGKSDNYLVHGSKLTPGGVDLHRRVVVMVRTEVSHVIGQLAGQEIRQQGDQPILGGVNHMTAQIVEWTIGEGRARTETVIRDKVNHIEMTIEMTIDVNKGGVPIDR